MVAAAVEDDDEEVSEEVWVDQTEVVLGAVVVTSTLLEGTGVALT